MARIKLIKLELREFQGGNVVINFDGSDINIYAANAVGKTRLASAWSWLLFDKDSMGRSDFEIKNRDANGQAFHNLEHTVEGVLDVDGETITLKKVYKEKWTKQRGRAEREFTGHTSDFFIDGVPVQLKDYKSKIAEICGDESIFRLLNSPTIFPALPWEKQRKLLLDVCGDVSDADVIAANDKLSGLPAILGKTNLDDHKKKINSRRTEINKLLESIPTRIDEVKRSLPDLTGLVQADIASDIALQDTTINEMKLSLQGIDTGGKIAELSKKLSIINTEIHKIEDAEFNKLSVEKSGIRNDIEKIDAVIRADKRRLQEITDEIKDKTKKSAGIDGVLALLRESWAKVEAEEFQDTVEAVCPACGQNLPSERVQEAREKALKVFNNSKANRLGEIESAGMAKKEEQKHLDDLILQRNFESQELEKHLILMQESLVPLKDKLDKLETSGRLSSPQTETLKSQKAEVEAEIEKEKAGVKQDADKIREEIANHEMALRTLKKHAACFVQAENGLKRINQLKDEENKVPSRIQYKK